MSRTPESASTLAGDFIRFEIRDGIRRVGCAVSDEALDAASGPTEPSTPVSRRRSFDRFRTLIHEAAVLRLRALPQGSVGPIVLTHRDLRRVPPETGAPAFGSSARGPTRPAAPGGVPPSAATASGGAASSGSVA